MNLIKTWTQKEQGGYGYEVYGKYNTGDIRFLNRFPDYIQAENESEYFKKQIKKNTIKYK